MIKFLFFLFILYWFLGAVFALADALQSGDIIDFKSWTTWKNFLKWPKIFLK